MKTPEPEKKPVSVLTGKPQGTSIDELFGEKGQTGSLPVNALLWRAALDIASYVPLKKSTLVAGLADSCRAQFAGAG